jgi:tight adherence protein C
VTLFVAIVFAAVAALGAAIATGVLGRGGAVEDRYAAKLAGIEDHAMSLEEMELSKPFRERFLVPIYNRLVQLLVARTPASRQDNIRKMIKSAGNPGNVSVSTILAAKFIAAMAALGVALLVMIGLLQWTFPWVLAAAAAGFVGWIVPDRWLKQVADRRRHGIEDVIPDTIDLLTICLDAGLSFDASMLRIGDKVEGPLREEFAAMLAEVRYGRPRMDALMAMAARIEVEDMTAFVNAVGQSQKLGVALGDTVRIQAAEIRRRRRQRAEERAAQASLKMLFPMIGCIFPTLFIVLMGPVALILLSRH